MLTWAVRLEANGQVTETNTTAGAARFDDAVSEVAASGYDAGTVRAFSRQVAGGSDNDVLKWSLAYKHYTWPLPVSMIYYSLVLSKYPLCHS